MNNEKLRGQLLGLYVLSAVALAILATVFVVWNLVLPYPIHGREYIEPSLSRLLLEGKDPYGMEQNPTYLYPYGIGYHVLIYPLVKLFGPTLLLLRTVSDIAMMLAAAVLFWGMRLTRVPALVALAGALLFYAHLACNDMCSGPNSLGVTLLLLGTVIPLATDFRWGGILGTIVVALLAFFTKHYDILCGPVLLLYLFLYRSKTAGVVAGVIFFALLAALLWLLASIFPLFLTNVIYHSYNYTQHFTSYGHLLRVMWMYFPMGIGLVALLAWWLRGLWTAQPSPLRTPWRWNLTDLRQPLIVQPALPWVDYLVVIYGVLYLVKMGPHAGNALSYVFELVTPFLIWRCCILAGVEFTRSAVPVACLLATVLLVGASLVVPSVLRCRHDYRPEWSQAAAEVAKYNRVLAPGELDGILQAQDKPVYDGGMTDLYGFCFPHNPCAIVPAYKQHCADFYSSLQQQVRGRQFDAIILYALPCVIDPLVPRDLVAQYYVKVGEQPLRTTLEPYRIEIWVPKPPGTIPAQ